MVREGRVGDCRQGVTEARASRLAGITSLRGLELEWCCRKSVQDERYIKVVDYSLVVNVAMDGLPTRLNRALFAAMSGTTWVRPLFGERGRGLLCIIWLTVSGLQ
jgi:hypothetical protein